jgi:multidrug efflux system outer membrane protein
MSTKSNYNIVLSLIIGLTLWGCSVPKIAFKETENKLPENFSANYTDSLNISKINWRDYFADDDLNALIDSALLHNQELNIVLQEIEISKSEVLEKKGEYLPFVDIGLGVGTEKTPRFTRNGSVEHNLEIDDGKAFPEPLNDFSIGANMSWEIDIWRKLRNAKDAAQIRYLAQTEGKNFLVTQLIAEVAESYYELEALDNLLKIINRNVSIQTEAYEKVKNLKEYAKTNQLVVNRFQAQLLNTQNQQYAIRQKITELENKLAFLTGTYSIGVNRNSDDFMELSLDSLQAGIPAQLLTNRPDIRKAELEMAAAKLDVKAARANFFPTLDLKAGVGFQAFNPKLLFNPESLLLNAAGDLMAPLINRAAIKAHYNQASAVQIQSVYAYEQTLLQAYTDVLNQLAKLHNYSSSLTTKFNEVNVLEESVSIANDLFQYAKADYVEVLLTQEEVLDAEMELVEIKLKQINTKIQMYRALGGGWQ